MSMWQQVIYLVFFGWIKLDMSFPGIMSELIDFLVKLGMWANS